MFTTKRRRVGRKTHACLALLGLLLCFVMNGFSPGCAPTHLRNRCTFDTAKNDVLSTTCMPNADTHDRITYLCAPVTFVGAQWLWQTLTVSLIATGAMLFAGLMFGPDLDLHSRPYRRWGPLRFIWKPYQ